MTNIKIYKSAYYFRKYNLEHNLPVYYTKNIHTPLSYYNNFLDMKYLTLYISFLVSHYYHRRINQ